MKINVSWLPKLLIFDEKTSFEEYYETVFQVFKTDFMDSRPIFRNKPIGLQKEPMVNGKPQTFHHMTTEDNKDKSARIISKERCERIKWNRPIIESNYVGLKIFKENRKHNRKNVIIWFQEVDYVIVLREAPTYFVFITAYPITKKHKKDLLQKSYEKYKKAETAS